jgi:nitrogen fixation NifU-like protein
MTNDSENIHELYQEIILDHNKRPRHYGVLEIFTDQVEGYNPLCGDKIQIYLQIEAGMIKAISFECAACAICKASSSIMCEKLVNADFRDHHKNIWEGLQLLNSKESGCPVVSGDLKALNAIHKFPARLNCAKLAWKTLDEYLSSKA